MLKHWGSLSQELCNCQYSIFLENLLGSFAVDLVGIVQGFEPVLHESCGTQRAFAWTREGNRLAFLSYLKA